MDRILLVDDSPLVQATLSRWLVAADYDVASAGSGEEALAAIAAHPPDLILLDLLMPGMGGLDMCRTLKGSDATSRIPVVVLTDADSSDNRIRSLEIGAEEFLTKPVDHAELLARVRSLLRAKHLSDRLLLSFLELDKLGAFAEAFTGQGVTEWKEAEVSGNMARHVLGLDGPLPNHPTAIWAGRIVQNRVQGICWYWRHGVWFEIPTSCQIATLQAALAPFAREGGELVSKAPPPPPLAKMLRFPADLAIGNFVGLAGPAQWLIAAGYPWEVGAYELPLLRALSRHWAVFERLRRESRLAELAFFSTIQALALAAEFYDRETANHVRRVSAYAEMVAATLGQGSAFMKWIGRSASLHDVGKITVPLDLVRKPAVLSGPEHRVMRLHTVNGAKLIGDLAPLAMARNIALHHHENADGSGYPDHLHAIDIPLEARIVRVVDVYDALRTLRAYKRAYSHEEALTVLRRGDERVSPRHFDPIVMTAFLDHQAEAAALHLELTRDHESGAFKPLVLPDE